MPICSKPGCTRAGAAVLGYDYAERLALLQDPPTTGQPSPHVYVLCISCAERLRPPQGWVLEDSRSEPPLFVAGDRPARSPVAIEEAIDEAEPATVRRQLFFGYSA
jgi:hypothetical protein